MSKRFEGLFEQTFLRAFVDGQFSARRFFELWYGARRNAYFFLFKKNLKITNIQYSELIALLRSYTSGQGGTAGRDLQFLSRREFNSAIAGIVATFPLQAPNERARLVFRLYGGLLKHLVIVEPYYSSCNIFLPPELSLDLKSICALSGYIHSCGRNLWTRNTRKAETASLFSNLKRYLTTRQGSRWPIFLAVYAHEDFSRYDRDDDAPQDGLDDVKVYVEKFFLGNEPLVAVLEKIRKAFGEQLVIPSPGDYRKQHILFRQRAHVDRARTLWLIVDRSVSEDGRRPGDTQYFICYEQQFKNENPLHLFDENKPAWIAHTTLPHTLMGALINITRPYWPSDDIRFADPFVGTGTCMLELCKEKGVAIHGSDLSALAPVLFEDNALLFYMSATKLRLLRVQITRLIRTLRAVSLEVTTGLSQSLLDKYVAASDFVLELRRGREIESVEFGVLAAAEMRRRTPQERLLVYLALRSLIRSGMAIKRESTDWWRASEKECVEWRNQLDALIRLRTRQGSIQKGGSGIIMTYQGSYSEACSINPAAFKAVAARHAANPVVTVCDAKNLEERTCDVVVTDPPYGFNTSDVLVDLAELYREMVIVMIRAVLPEGQLVFCLPEHSYSGRRLHFFTLREMVTQQVLFAANQLKVDVVVTGQSMPEPTSLFRPPYYWESLRALRRSILHFRVRERTSETEATRSCRPAPRSSGVRPSPALGTPTLE